VVKLKKETIFYILSFFAVVLAVTGAISYTGTNENLEKFHQVEIEEGDSLWSIAEQFHENANITKQDFVIWVQDKNKMNSSVVKPGDLVFVPVEKEQIYQFEQIASE
jgi:cell division protein YceG involved in septum cleavage